MENEEYQKRKIRTAYTEIMRRLIDRDFAFPAGGKVNIQLSKFIEQFTAYCGGAFNDARLVDYCVFQIHKNRNAKFQKNLAVTAFGQTAFNKYKAMAGKNKNDDVVDSIAMLVDYTESFRMSKVEILKRPF